MKIIQLATVALVYLAYTSGSGSAYGGIALALAALAMSFLFPQVMFKSGVRTLTISEAGISTTIGSQSGQVAWTSIRRIEDPGDRIMVVGKNLNSFVIPSRAFSSESERKHFLEKAQAWLRMAAQTPR